MIPSNKQCLAFSLSHHCECSLRHSTIKYKNIRVFFFSGSVFEQLGQLANEHGGQRQEQEGQQPGTEENEISGRSEEPAEETQLVVLDPEHVRSLQILPFLTADVLFVFIAI